MAGRAIDQEKCRVLLFPPAGPSLCKVYGQIFTSRGSVKIGCLDDTNTSSDSGLMLAVVEDTLRVNTVLKEVLAEGDGVTFPKAGDS